jgi:hypothetical protein
MKWHVPTDDEVNYAKSLFFQIYNPILERYNAIYFSNLPSYDYSNEFTSILDTALLAPENQSRVVKLEHQRYLFRVITVILLIIMKSKIRSIMVLFHLYSSIATRVKWGIDSSDKVYDVFSKSFCLSEYNSIN